MPVETIALGAAFAVAVFAVARWLGAKLAPWPEALASVAIYVVVTLALWNSGIDRFIVTLLGIGAAAVLIAAWKRLAPRHA